MTQPRRSLRRPRRPAARSARLLGSAESPKTSSKWHWTTARWPSRTTERQLFLDRERAAHGLRASADRDPVGARGGGIAQLRGAAECDRERPAAQDVAEDLGPV